MDQCRLAASKLSPPLLALALALPTACRPAAGPVEPAPSTASSAAEVDAGATVSAEPATAGAPADSGPAAPPEPEAKAPPGPRVPYFFKVNGHKMWADVFQVGDPDGPAGPGDVADFHTFIVALDEPGTYELQRPRDHDRIFRVAADGAKALVWARTKGGLKLDPADLATLRGLRVERWTPQVEALLAGADLSRLCVSLDGTASLRGYGMKLPPLPAGLRCLSTTNFRNFEGLERLTELRYLAVSGAPAELDAAWLSGGSELRVARLGAVKNLAALPSLPALHHLGLFSEELRDLSPFAKAPGLRFLHTGAPDLSGLAGLPRLERLVPGASFSSLPAGSFPSLRSIRAVGARLSKAQTDEFAAANPQCTVVTTANELIQAAMSGATRVRIRTGCLVWGHWRPADENTLLELTDPAEIADFTSHIVLDETEGSFESMGCTSHTFEFYRGDELIYELSFSENFMYLKSLDWFGDISLSRASAEWIYDWFRAHGIRLCAEIMGHEC